MTPRAATAALWIGGTTWVTIGRSLVPGLLVAAVAAGGSRRKLTELEHQLTERDRLLATAQARIVALEAEATALRSRLSRIASMATEAASLPSPVTQHVAARPLSSPPASKAPASLPVARPDAERSPAEAEGTGALHPAARKLLTALAQHAPARFTWGQAATLAGLKPNGGHYNAGRKQLRDMGLVEEATDRVTVSPAGGCRRGAAGAVQRRGAPRPLVLASAQPGAGDAAHPGGPRRALRRAGGTGGRARQEGDRRPLEQRRRTAAQQWTGRDERQARVAELFR